MTDTLDEKVHTWATEFTGIPTRQPQAAQIAVSNLDPASDPLSVNPNSGDGGLTSATPDVISGADPKATAATGVQSPAPDPKAATPDVISGADPKAVPAAQKQQTLSKPPPVAIPPADDEPSQPHIGVDLQIGVPWSIQGSLVLKDFNLKSYGDPKKLSVDLFHEPTLSVTFDPKGNGSAQQLVGLADLHFFPLWKKETEVSLSAFINEQFTPPDPKSHQGPVTGGLQLQAEQHITGMLSVTFSVSGTFGADTFLSVGGGLLIHFDPNGK